MHRGFLIERPIKWFVGIGRPRALSLQRLLMLGTLVKKIDKILVAGRVVALGFTSRDDSSIRRRFGYLLVRLVILDSSLYKILYLFTYPYDTIAIANLRKQSDIAVPIELLPFPI